MNQRDRGKRVAKRMVGNGFGGCRGLGGGGKTK